MSSTAVTWIVIGVIVVLVLWIISIYNGLVAMRQRFLAPHLLVSALVLCGTGCGGGGGFPPAWILPLASAPAHTCEHSATLAVSCS